LYHPTLGLRVVKKKKKDREETSSSSYVEAKIAYSTPKIEPKCRGGTSSSPAAKRW